MSKYLYNFRSSLIDEFHDPVSLCNRTESITCECLVLFDYARCYDNINIDNRVRRCPFHSLNTLTILTGFYWVLKLYHLESLARLWPKINLFVIHCGTLFFWFRTMLSKINQPIILKFTPVFLLISQENSSHDILKI